jgi:hypothetical protein
LARTVVVNAPAISIAEATRVKKISADDPARAARP